MALFTKESDIFVLHTRICVLSKTWNLYITSRRMVHLYGFSLQHYPSSWESLPYIHGLKFNYAKAPLFIVYGHVLVAGGLLLQHFAFIHNLMKITLSLWPFFKSILPNSLFHLNSFLKSLFCSEKMKLIFLQIPTLFSFSLVLCKDLENIQACRIFSPSFDKKSTIIKLV